MIKTRLYCGLETKTGPKIIKTQVDVFLKTVVGSRFEGFTIYYVDGFWNSTKENSMVIEMIHENSIHENSAIDIIAEAYCKRFDQQAVLRTDEKINVRLITCTITK